MEPDGQQKLAEDPTVFIDPNTYQVGAINNNFFLRINGAESICPFKTIYPGQTQLGATAWATHVCNTQCPLAKVVLQGGAQFYTTSCGSHQQFYKLTVPEENPAPKSSIITE